MRNQPTTNAFSRLLIEYDESPYSGYAIDDIANLIEENSTYSSTPIQVLREFLNLGPAVIASALKLPADVYVAKEKQDIFDADEYIGLCLFFSQAFSQQPYNMEVIFTPSLFLKTPSRPAPLQMLIATKRFVKNRAHAGDIFSEEYKYELNFYAEQLDKAFEIIGGTNRDEQLIGQACAAFLRAGKIGVIKGTFDEHTALQMVLAHGDDTLIHQAVKHYMGQLDAMLDSSIEDPKQAEKRLYVGMLKEAKTILGESKKYAFVNQIIKHIDMVNSMIDKLGDPDSQNNMDDPTEICMQRDFHRETFINFPHVILDALETLSPIPPTLFKGKKAQAMQRLGFLARQYWGLGVTTADDRAFAAGINGKHAKLQAYTDSMRPEDYSRFIRNYLMVGGHHEYNWVWDVTNKLTTPNQPLQLRK